MFYRTARMLEAGIRPVFVFDGKPPELKRKQLDQRLERCGVRAAVVHEHVVACGYEMFFHALRSCPASVAPAQAYLPCVALFCMIK